MKVFARAPGNPAIARAGSDVSNIGVRERPTSSTSFSLMATGEFF
jgi:hypothetical protein